jgi:serine/threonine protein kinase
MQSGKFIGQYRILKTLGTGASCKVKLAEDTLNGNKRVAVKIMNENIGEAEKSLLYTEINTMQCLNHKNIVKYLECGHKEYTKPSGNRAVSYIALELAEAGELFDFVANTGRFSEKVSRHYFKELCGALKSCHDSGVYHRDLKAENIFMNNKFELKVGDFGFATTWAKAD